MSAATNFPQRRLKYVATLNDEALPESTDPEFEIAYIDIGNVDSQGRIHDIVAHRFETAPSRARRIVRDGDVVISTVRTYLQAIAPIEKPCENLIVSTGFAVVRPSARLDHRYCKYALRANRFLWEVESRSTGVSYPAINASDLADIKISLPPLAEQRVIANYLDRETARIDGLIADKERMLALLEEKRAALISRVVTCGLDTNVPLKPSGEDWLAEVPGHWRLIRAKALFREVDIRSATGEETLLSLRLGKGLVPHRDVSDKPLEASDVVGFKQVEVGQMVINRMRAASGLIAVAEQPGLVSPDYAVFEILGRDLCIEYFLELFKTPLLQAVFRSSSKGLGTGEQGFLRLYTDAFLALHFPYPPESEQWAIAEFIKRERCEFQATEDLLRRSIELARERRSALITAAVTGQIPVKEMTA